MTRRGDAPDPQRGGSNVHFRNDAFAPNIPQRDSDQALVQTVRANLSGSYKAAFAAGQIDRGKMLALVRRATIDCARQLAANPFKTLTSKQRAFLIKWCPKDKQALFLVPGTPPIPEVLKNLPKKPPLRRQTDEDE